MRLSTKAAPSRFFNYKEVKIAILNQPGLTQREIARIVNVSAPYLSRLITGKLPIPKNNRLLTSFAGVLRVSPSRIIKEEK